MTVCFTTDRMLHFGDCDISGTAYYPAYLNILNGVVEEFWAHIGWPWHEIIWNERWGTPTVHLSCDFSKPSFFGDTLTFRLTILKVGNRSACATPSIAARRIAGRSNRFLRPPGSTSTPRCPGRTR